MHQIREYFSDSVLAELMRYFGDVGCESEDDSDYDEYDDYDDYPITERFDNGFDYAADDDYDSNEPLYGGVSDDWEEYWDTIHG